ncbi:MAG TPA: DUF3489 domain-containing protein [Caulobacteraceae bacterium]|nr:DUF3489 domain-containing protein [Caulobacteraceae bacterium]
MAKTNTQPQKSARTRKAGAPTSAASSPPDAPTPAPDTAAAKAPSGKLGTVVELLKGPEGATIEALSAATGWQVHSVRGAMSGALKKKHGLTILSEKTEAGRIYRIPTAPPIAEAGA